MAIAQTALLGGRLWRRVVATDRGMALVFSSMPREVPG